MRTVRFQSYGGMAGAWGGCPSAGDGVGVSLSNEIKVEQVWPCRGEGVSLYGEVQCIMGKVHMGPHDIQTYATENSTFLQLRWRW